MENVALNDKYLLYSKDDTAREITFGHKLWSVFTILQDGWVMLRCKGNFMAVNLVDDPHFSVEKISK